MSKPSTLPASPLLTWTPEERVMHEAIVGALKLEERNVAVRVLARLNASLASRGAPCGYTIG